MSARDFQEAWKGPGAMRGAGAVAAWAKRLRAAREARAAAGAAARTDWRSRRRVKCLVDMREMIDAGRVGGQERGAKCDVGTTDLWFGLKTPGLKSETWGTQPWWDSWLWA